MKRLLVLTTTPLTLALALASPAAAGTYEVKACIGDGGNASWSGHVNNGYVTAYTSCPGEGIVTRMSGGAGNAPNFSNAHHQFTAPPGTRIVSVRGNFRFHSQNGWYVGLVSDQNQWIWCGGSFPNCSSWGQYWGTSVGMSTSWVRAQVVCFNGNGCPRNDQYGILAMRDVVVTVDDPTPPSVAITGGSVTVAGWRRGDQDIGLSGWDSSGIRRIETYIDGRFVRSHPGRCDDVSPRPCDDNAAALHIYAHEFGGDGQHRLTIKAYDAAGNVSQAVRDVLIDNTAPGQALDARLDGGDNWRARNSFTVGWRNPAQNASAIASARYLLCPAANVGGDHRNCGSGTVRGRSVTSIADLRVPKPGEWRVALWLEDEAGNSDSQRSVSIGVLRFDDDDPTAAIAPMDDRDPTRVHVLAKDATSGIATGQIEARREGEDAWRSLVTRVDDLGISANLDDELLPKGRYELRARVVDHAGNERSTQAEPNGAPATRTLPVRITTRLAVGKPQRVLARNAKGKRRYRTVLRVSPRASFGRTIPLQGRLTMPGANPLADADIEVWERVHLPSAEWRRVSIVRTSRTGRFRFKALRGPSRTLKFRYPGTATIRSRSTEVDLGIRASTTFRVNRHRVVNGEEVRFLGRLRGRQTGDTGKLLYLQVYTRGRWSTFATPRANRVSGRWSEPYRFSATRGIVSYRFRVLIPREASFPYETGRSRSLRVTVRGL